MKDLRMPKLARVTSKSVSANKVKGVPTAHSPKQKSSLPYPVYVENLEDCKHNVKQRPTVRIRKSRSGLDSLLLNKLDSANVALVTGEWTVSRLNVETRTYNLRGSESGDLASTRPSFDFGPLTRESKVTHKQSQQNIRNKIASAKELLDAINCNSEPKAYSKNTNDGNSPHSIARDSAVSLLPVTAMISRGDTSSPTWLSDVETKKPPITVRMRHKPGHSPNTKSNTIARSNTTSTRTAKSSNSTDNFLGRSGSVSRGTSHSSSLNTGSAEILSSVLASASSGELKIATNLEHLVMDFSENYATPPVTHTKHGMKVIKLPAHSDNKLTPSINADELSMPISNDDRLDEDYWLQEDAEELSVNCASITARTVQPIVSKNVAEYQEKHKALDLTEMLGEDMTFTEFMNFCAPQPKKVVEQPKRKKSFSRSLSSMIKNNASIINIDR